MRSEDVGEFLCPQLEGLRRSEGESTYMLVEVLGYVRHIEVCVAVVSKFLELRVEGFLTANHQREPASVVKCNRLPEQN